MPDRDASGRFLPGNKIASLGGRACQAKLSSEERRARGKAGFAALCKKWGWSKRKTAAWLFDPLNYHVNSN